MRSLLLSLLILLSSSAFCQLIFKSGFEGGKWISLNGPEGGTALVLTVSPKDANLVFAGTSGGGIFKSVNGGKDWFSANNGLEHYLGWTIISAVAVSYVDIETVYIAIFNGGLFKTIDGGETWESASNGIEDLSLFDIKVDLQSNDILYAATHYGGLYKSVNGGAHWNVMSFPDQFMSAFTTDPNNSSNLYTAFRDSENIALTNLYKSTDGGSNWSNVSGGIFEGAEVYSITVDPGSSEILYIGASDGIHKSVNGGETWDLIIGSPTYLKNIHFSVENPGLMYAGAKQGIWKTTDDGMQWIQIFGGLGVLGINPKQDSVLFGSRFGVGVFKTTDGGKNWAQSNAGVHNTRPAALAIHPVSSDLYAAGRDRVSKYNRAGWSHVYEKVYLNSDSIVIETNVPNAIYVSSRGGSFGAIRSDDEGQSWSIVNAGLEGEGLFKIVKEDSSNDIYGSNVNSVFRLVDGPYWSLLSDQVSDESNPIWCIAIDSTNSGTIYTGGNQGIFKSIDSGSTWFAANNGLSNSAIWSIAPHPVNTGILYAGNAGGEVFKTLDGGDSWTSVLSTQAVSGIYVEVRGILINPYDPDTIFVSIRSVGVLKSVDGGDNWIDISDGLPTRQVSGLALDSANNTLYVGTTGLGVFKYVLPY